MGAREVGGGVQAENAGVALLGRERELAELALALSEAKQGRGQFCLLAGEPGIGKTSLASVIARRAQDDGAVVRWGRAWEGGAPAFWPWVEIVRGLCRDREPELVRRWLGAGAPWVAQIVPDLREQLPDIEPPGAIETEQARFALFDAVATFLRNACEQPLALMLDDLHAADPATLLMLEFVARGVRDAPIFLLASYQEAAAHARPEIDDVVGELVRESRHMVLGRLGVDELAGLVERRAGTAPAPELVRELHETTEGNPFFANEVVRLLVVEGQLDDRVGGARARFSLPDTVRDAIRRRFAPLGSPALETLEMAAVIGREFRLPALEGATGADRDELIQTLDRAVVADLLVEVPDAPGVFRFAHGLMRETLYGELPPTRRIKAHGVVGDTLEELYSDAPDRYLDELAHHYLAAAPAGYAEKAVKFATRAGERAMRLLAYEDASRLFAAALEALELGPPDPAQRAELLLRLGTAQVRAGDDSARSTLIGAATAARGLERPEIVAHAALAFRAFARAPGVDDEEVVALLEEGIEGTGADDSELRARLLVRLAVQIYARHEIARRQALVDEAIAIARRVGDDETLAYVLSNAQLATWGPDTRDQALAWSGEVLDLAERVGDAALVLTTHSRQVDFLIELDDLPGADVEIETLGRKVDEHPEPRARAHLALQRARRATIEGRFDEAERLTSEAEVLGRRVADAAIRVVCVGQRWGVRWSQGRLAEVEAPTRQLADALPGMPVWRAALALTYHDVGRVDEARGEFERLAEDDFAGIPRNDAWLLATAILAELCARLGDAERGRTLSELLSQFADRNVVSFHGLYLGPVARYLALLAAVAEDWDTAARHLSDAKVSAARAGARPVLEIVRADEDRILAASGREDSAPAATEAAGASLRREGDVWLFEYGGASVRVRDSKGLRYLAKLLESPGVEVHALDLMGAGEAPAADAAAAADAGLSVSSGGDDAGPLLDREAKAAYRDRLEGLREELEEAESFNDPERAARAREEMEFIAGELAGAVGLGGRDRKAASNAERARVNVTRSIRGVIKRIVDFDANLGRELESTVRTGTFCAYEPDPRRPVSWSIEG